MSASDEFRRTWRKLIDEAKCDLCAKNSYGGGMVLLDERIWHLCAECFGAYRANPSSFCERLRSAEAEA